jgi:hypothetical protein
MKMAKTRLLNADRDVIEAAILAHRFDPLDAAYLAEENALAIKIRAKVYGDFLPTMEAAPAGAFPENNAIRVNVDGRRILLNFEYQSTEAGGAAVSVSTKSSSRAAAGRAAGVLRPRYTCVMGGAANSGCSCGNAMPWIASPVSVTGITSKPPSVQLRRGGI